MVFNQTSRCEATTVALQKCTCLKQTAVCTVTSKKKITEQVLNELHHSASVRNINRIETLHQRLIKMPGRI